MTLPPRPRRLGILLALATAALLAGCALEPVRPWQKEHLAHPEMSFEADRLDARYTDHVYFSREASSGGAGIGGGGCGCN
jgi:hypothetical protein